MEVVNLEKVKEKVDFKPPKIVKVAVGSDHGGALLKNHIKKYLEEKGFLVQDFGGDPEVSTDYPQVAFKLGEAVAKGEFEFGVLCCGTGIGISIAANKVKGVRAALCFNTTMARLAKQHNNANVIVMGGRIIGPVLAEDIVQAYIDAKFEGGRHQRRVDQIADYEK